MKRPVVWVNCEEVLERVCTDQNNIGRSNIILTLDGGGGFFKVSVTILLKTMTERLTLFLSLLMRMEI